MPGLADAGMGLHLRAFAAVMRKEARLMRRHPLTLLNTLLLMPLYQLVLPVLLLGSAFLVRGRSAGIGALTGTADSGGWLAIGMAGALLTSTVLAGPAQAVTGERSTGTLELTWTMPVRPGSLVLGSMAGMTALALVSGTAVIGLSALLFGAEYGLDGLLALPVLAVLLPGLAGQGLMSAALVLRWRQAMGITDNVGYLVSVLAGVTFPIAVVSGVLQPIAYLIPTTWAIDLARHLALGADTFLPPTAEFAALASSSAAYLACGRYLFASAERRLRNDGSISQH
ncbi:ABC transporter permease [Actinomadura fibrosa]|uniref:ABC transporter permease n=1 Tax=Actinomadura fibrosa TaxID=111802 RepID=UPI001A95624B|nr:ABC transporter permease [Actinomadura fibrosa]